MELKIQKLLSCLAEICKREFVTSKMHRNVASVRRDSRRIYLDYALLSDTSLEIISHGKSIRLCADDTWINDSGKTQRKSTDKTLANSASRIFALRAVGVVRFEFSMN